MEFVVQSKEQLEQFILQNSEAIKKYFDKLFQEMKTKIPIYCSVDIRENRYKYAPVDHNFYPAGFNNIMESDLITAAKEFRLHIEGVTINGKGIAGHNNRILLVPESNTRNTYYLDNVATLVKCLQMADFQVELISFDESLFSDSTNADGQLELISHSGETLKLTLVRQVEDKLTQKIKNDWAPLDAHILILNHDQSRPLPVDWGKLSLSVLPSPYVGWDHRTKSGHFMHYHHVVKAFSDHFKINPSVLEAQFDVASEIDFQSKEGLLELEQRVDSFLTTLPEGTKVFVKANQGTYGMGISVVDTGKEISDMNRKTRNKMDAGKNNIKFRSVILQESVETILERNGMPAEVTVYLVNAKPIGALLRSNTLRGAQDNLNSKGMVLEKLSRDDVGPAYLLIAQLSALASCYEL